MVRYPAGLVQLWYTGSAPPRPRQPPVFAEILENGRLQNGDKQFKSLTKLLKEKGMSHGRTEWKYVGGLYDGKTTIEARAVVQATRILPCDYLEGGASGSDDTERYDDTSPSSSPPPSPPSPPVFTPNLSAVETSKFPRDTPNKTEIYQLPPLELPTDTSTDEMLEMFIDEAGLDPLFVCQDKRPRIHRSLIERPEKTTDEDEDDVYDDENTEDQDADKGKDSDRASTKCNYANEMYGHHKERQEWKELQQDHHHQEDTVIRGVGEEPKAGVAKHVVVPPYTGGTLAELNNLVAQLRHGNAAKDAEIETLKAEKEAERAKNDKYMMEARKTKNILKDEHDIIFIDKRGEECTNQEDAFLGKGTSGSAWRVKKAHGGGRSGNGSGAGSSSNDSGSHSRSSGDDQLYALKLIPTQELTSNDIAQLQKEVEFLSELDDGHYIIRYYDSFVATINGTMNLAIRMEYAAGGSLLKLISSDVYKARSFDEEQVLEMLEQPTHALRYLHSKGKLHRDIHPGNILVMADGSLRLADFGLAKELSARSTLSTNMPSLYASKEKAMNTLTHDARDDCWGLGAVLSELVTKKLLSKRIGNGMLWMNPPVVQQIVAECTALGTRFIGEIVQKLLRIDALPITNPQHRLTAQELHELLRDRRRVVGVFSSPERHPNGSWISATEHLPLMQEMRAMQRAIGEEQCYLCPAASISDLKESIVRHHPETLVIACHGQATCILLQDANGKVQVLSTENFLKLLSYCTRLKRLFLNACNTEALAKAAVKQLPHLQVICWGSAVNSTAAQTFAKAALNTIGIDDSNTSAGFAKAFTAGGDAFEAAGFKHGVPTCEGGTGGHGVMRFVSAKTIVAAAAAAAAAVIALAASVETDTIAAQTSQLYQAQQIQGKLRAFVKGGGRLGFDTWAERDCCFDSLTRSFTCSGGNGNAVSAAVLSECRVFLDVPEMSVLGRTYSSSRFDVKDGQNGVLLQLAAKTEAEQRKWVRAITMGTFGATFGDDTNDINLHSWLASVDRAEVKKVDLCYCKPAARAAFAALALAAKCPGLQFINLPGCARITDAGVMVLAEKCPGLQYIGLQGCALVTDAGVTALAENCPGLQHIDLEGCALVTDAGVTALVENCPGLQHIDLEGCALVTDGGWCCYYRCCCCRRCCPDPAGLIALLQRFVESADRR
jgi:serine/threonine protein kinase